MGNTPRTTSRETRDGRPDRPPPMREADRRLPRERHRERAVPGVPARPERVHPGGTPESEARGTRGRRESRCEDANAPDANPLSTRDTGRERDPAPVGMEVRGERRLTVQGGSEGWATLGHRRRRVIKPNVGGTEVRRLRAWRWRKRPDRAVVPATGGRNSAIASVVPVARAALTRLSSPVTARLTEADLR